MHAYFTNENEKFSYIFLQYYGDNEKADPHFWFDNFNKNTISFYLGCEQALLFGQAKRASREREGLLSAAPRGFAARSRVLARLVSLAQIGELARRLLFIKQFSSAWT